MGEKTDKSNKIALVLIAISIILSVGASVFMSFWGASYAASNLETGEILSSGRTGAFHPILMIFVLFPVAGLVGVQWENKNVLRASAIGMPLLAMLSLFGVGLPFLLASIPLVSAAVVYERGLK